MKIFGKVLLACLCSLFVWELILRNFVVLSQGATMHPELGRVYKTGIYLHGEEGHSRTFINQLGMRDEKKSLLGSNLSNILILGDSFTEAFQVEDSFTYSNRFQEILALNGTFINSINAGRSGASPAFYIHLASFYKKLFQPVAVVIQVNDGDFTEDMINSQRSFYVEKRADIYRTVFDNNFRSPNRLLQNYPIFDACVGVSVLRKG